MYTIVESIDLDYSMNAPAGSPAIDNLSKCVGNIAVNNFQWRYITLVIYNSSLIYGIERLIQEYGKSVMVGNNKFDPRYAEQTRQYLVLGTDLDNIRNMLDWLKMYKFDNTGKHIIVCGSSIQKDCDEVKAINLLWEYRITNILFMKFDMDSKIVTFTYNIHENKCGLSEPKQLKTLCIEEQNNYIPGNHVNLFFNKFRNLHRCPIIASTFEHKPYMMIKNGTPSGADGNLLLLLAEGLNATLKIITPTRGEGWGGLDDNNEWTGSMADVYYDLANLSMTSAGLTLARCTNFEMSKTYNYKTLIWVSSPAVMESASLKLLHPFKPITFMVVAMSYVIVIILVSIRDISCLKMLNYRTGTTSSWTTIIFNSWKICMGLPLDKLPKNSELLYIIAIWILYCFLLRTFYQASLVTSLQTDKYNSVFESIEDVIKANYKFGGVFTLKDYYKEYPEVYNYWVNVVTHEVPSILINISHGAKFVMALNTDLVKTVAPENIHVLPRYILSSPTVIFLKKFSPLTSPVNEILTRLVESGLSDKIFQQYMKVNTTSKVKDQSVPIKLQHYTGCYALLLCGYVVSGICFLIEILCKTVKKSSK